MTDKIKPCPNCGNPDVYCLEADMCRYDVYSVVCENVPDDHDDVFCYEGPEYKEDRDRAIREHNEKTEL